MRREGGMPVAARRRPESRRAGRDIRRIILLTFAGKPISGHSRLAGMYAINHWIPRPSFQTRLYHPALAGTPPEEGNWNHLDGLFPTPLYHLHPCRRVSMQAGLRRNDGKGNRHLSIIPLTIHHTKALL